MSFKIDRVPGGVRFRIDGREAKLWLCLVVYLLSGVGFAADVLSILLVARGSYYLSAAVLAGSLLLSFWLVRWLRAVIARSG